MALHDGFFDAVPDGVHEDGSTKYDREYDVEAFTTYFGQIVGSGVCVYRNADSYRVRLEGGSAVVSPGYLFINGHWLKNDADYTVELTGTGVVAIAAHLNAGAKRIDIEARSAAQSYPDSLVLALVNVESGTAEDTRYNSDICGVIDSAGGVSNRIVYCQQYIDTQIQKKLDKAEADINAQSVKLDKAIANVSMEVDRIVPQPVGAIKFSMSQNVGEEWLKCDGRYITENEYPDLVDILSESSYVIPGTKELPAIQEPFTNIGNSTFYQGRIWFFSKSHYKLFGISISGEPTKEIEVLKPDGQPYKPSPSYDIYIVGDGDDCNLYFGHPSISFKTVEDGGTAVPGRAYIESYTVSFSVSWGFDPESASIIAEDVSSVLTELPDSEYNYIADTSGYSPYSDIVGYSRIGNNDLHLLATITFCTKDSWTPSGAGNLAKHTSMKRFLAFLSLQKDKTEVKFAFLDGADRYNEGYNTAKALLKNHDVFSGPIKELGGILYFSRKEYPLGIYVTDGETEKTVGISSKYDKNPFNPNGTKQVYGMENGQILGSIYARSSGLAVRFWDVKSMTSVDTTFKKGISNDVSALYLEKFNLWAMFSVDSVAFLRDLSNGDQMFVQSFETFINAPAGTTRYCGFDGDRTLYFGYITTQYKLVFITMEIPDGFSPFDGTYIPSLSMSGVPAYIKAYEPEDES